MSLLLATEAAWRHSYRKTFQVDYFNFFQVKMPYQKLHIGIHSGTVWGYASIDISGELLKSLLGSNLDFLRWREVGTQKTLEKFTANVYGCENPKLSLNEFRYEVFDRAFWPEKNSSNQLERLSGMNASMLPPCQAEVTSKLKRVKFVAKMWWQWWQVQQRRFTFSWNERRWALKIANSVLC